MTNPGQTHWHGCATEGGPAHNKCAVAEIERLRETNEKIKRSAVSAGCCPTCLVQAPEPYGCTDCLNTGWAMGGPPGFVSDETYNDAKTEITRLRALATPKPIETAPINEWVLVFNRRHGSRWVIAIRPDPKYRPIGWSGLSSEIYLPKDLTHWLPLPQAPK